MYVKSGYRLKTVTHDIDTRINGSRRTERRYCPVRPPASGVRRGARGRQHRHYRPASGRANVLSTLTGREGVRLAMDSERPTSGVGRMSQTEPAITPAVPEVLPHTLAGELEDLDKSELRAAFEYSRSLLRSRHDPRYRRELRERQDRIRGDEHDDRLVIREATPCSDNCEECPNGQYLCHVTRADKDERRYRVPLGKIEDRVRVRRGP